MISRLNPHATPWIPTGVLPIRLPDILPLSIPAPPTARADTFWSASRQWLQDVRENRKEAVLQALKSQNPCIHAADARLGNAISVVAATGNAEMLDLLLSQSDIDYNHRNAGSRTPLSLAAMKGNLDIVKRLLQEPAIDISCNLKDSHGLKPYDWAMLRGYKDVAKAIQKHQLRHQLFTPFADPELFPQPSSPTKPATMKSPYPQTEDRLHQAAYQGNDAEVDALLKDTSLSDETVDAPQYYGMTPLACAAAQGHVSTMRRLLQDPRVGLNTLCVSLGKTPLQYAAKHGQADTASLLLQQPNILLNHADREGNTALHLVVQNGCSAEPIGDFYHQNATPEVQEGSTRILKELLQQEGIQVNRRNKYGRTALIESIRQGSDIHFDLLMKHPDIKVNIPDKKGLTPLHHAVLEKRESMLNTLLHHPHVAIDQPDNAGHTPLIYAHTLPASTFSDLLLKHVMIQALEHGKQSPEDQESQVGSPLSTQGKRLRLITDRKTY